MGGKYSTNAPSLLPPGEPGSVCFKMGDGEMACNVIHVPVGVVHAAFEWGLQLCLEKSTGINCNAPI